MFIIGLKKMSEKIISKEIIPEKIIFEENMEYLELDELYCYIGQKSHTKTYENTYIITMVSRSPRQIAGFDAAFDKSPDRIQKIVDSGPEAKFYCTDGYTGYIDVVYPGKHIRNVKDKNDTFTVEGVNADMRHYIPIPARRSRCFPRKLQTLLCVLNVFVTAYNKFGFAKFKYRKFHKNSELPFSLVDFI